MFVVMVKVMVKVMFMVMVIVRGVGLGSSSHLYHVSRTASRLTNCTRIQLLIQTSAAGEGENMK